MTATLIAQYHRDLDRLSREIIAYNREEDLWATEKGINNSAGNLCLHIVGNLQHFIGNVLGKSGYVRNREAEFNDRGISREVLLKQINLTRQSIETTLQALTPQQLDALYPVEVFGEPMTTTYFLIHLLGHLNYHLGQVNYHRRLVARA